MRSAAASSGSCLLTDRLLKQAATTEERRAVLANVLDEFGMAAYQVSARYWFERSLYDSIKEGKFLDGDTVASLWVKARDAVYEDAVEWLPEMRWEWTMKLHYYLPNYRFYNYPYVFAQLFVFALYRLYQEQGRGFVPKLREILSAGSRRSPAQLAAGVGFDITTEDFWGKGITQFEELVDQLESTLEGIGRAFFPLNSAHNPWRRTAWVTVASTVTSASTTRERLRTSPATLGRS